MSTTLESVAELEVGEGGQRTDSSVKHETSSLTLGHRDYMVGWICALPKEQTAATVMLDTIHPDLPKPADDMNTYTLGSSGKHNVVIACLPKGQYGTITAAKVATWMTSTFPAIRVGLLVGIGGGIPSKVRLGDVVVSVPGNGYPGVVQWDMGKTEDGGRFKRTGALNNPPAVLLTALSKLETLHAMRGPLISHYLNEVKTRYPNLDGRYTQPSALKDPTGNSDTPGPVSAPQPGMFTVVWRMLVAFVMNVLGWKLLQSTPTASGVGATAETSVTARDCEIPATVGGPNVHYGLIASGNQVIKDSALRDQLDKSMGGNVLCIEMEAAGLMNEFPCVVIRGICDYADSHKNKDWQEYAAATAAGYAKDLLKVVSPLEIKSTTEARYVVEMLQDIASTSKNIAQTQEQQILQGKRQKLSQWLSPLNPYARHSENQKQRVEGTSTWLLEDHRFIDWLSTDESCPVLCCFGAPGAGKTIISSVVIDALDKYTGKTSGIGTAYVYCDYRDQTAQTMHNIVGAISEQLLRRLPDIPSEVLKVYQKYGDGKSSVSSQDLKDVFRLVCAEFQVVYICLDAIDELDDLAGTLEFLQGRQPHVRLFLTGRQHVQNILTRYMHETSDILIEARKDDIERFVVREIGGPNDAEPAAMDEELRRRILTRIVESAQGIFLLPVLQIRSVLQHLTLREREDSLARLPSSLGEAFAKTFLRIQRQPETRSNRAAYIIAWVHLALQPLTIGQLLCALAVREGDRCFNHRGLPVRATLLDCCCGLVIMDSETKTIRLVHYSLQEHLQDQSTIFKTRKEEWHRRIAASSLTFLMFPPPAAEQHTDRALIQSEFLKYTALNWGHHLRLSGHMSNDILDLATTYLTSGWKINHDGSQLLLRRILGWRSVSDAFIEMRPNHLAAFFGLPQLILKLNSTAKDLDVRDRSGNTVLLVAIRKGFEEVVQILLERGACVHKVSLGGLTALMAAAKRGHVSIVNLLLAHPKVSVKSRDRKGLTALHHAAAGGQNDVVQLLIAHPEVDPNAQDERHETALHRAAYYGCSDVIDSLIAHPEVDLNAQDRRGITPLHRAAERDHHECVQLLLACPELDINRQSKGVLYDDDPYGWTALHYAVFEGHMSITRLILARDDLDLNVQDSFGSTALHVAVQSARIDMVRLLLAHEGLDIDQKNRRGWTAAEQADRDDQPDIAHLLRQHQIQVIGEE